MSARRVPFLPAGTAGVYGVSAVVVSRLMAHHLGAVVRELGLPPEAVNEVMATREAIRLAADAWQGQQTTVTANGKTEGGETEADAPSPHDQLSTAEVMDMTGLSDGRIRQLARAGHIGRRVGGRWVFERAAVLAYMESRAA